MIRFLRKKGRLKTKRGFQTAFGLYAGLNENGTIFLLPGFIKAEHHDRWFFKGSLGFSGFSTSGLCNQIQEYQRLFADVFECVGLAGAGDGNVADADFGLFAFAIGKQAFAGYDDVNVFIAGMFVLADGSARR